MSTTNPDTVSEKRVDDAVSSLSHLWLTAVAIYLVWLLTLPSAWDRLSRHPHARHLHAWLLLNDFAETLPRSWHNPYHEGGTLTSASESRPSPYRERKQEEKRTNIEGREFHNPPLDRIWMDGEDRPRELPLKVESAWPKPRTTHLKLWRESHPREYVIYPSGEEYDKDRGFKGAFLRVLCEDGTLPFNEYEILLPDEATRKPVVLWRVGSDGHASSDGAKSWLRYDKWRAAPAKADQIRRLLAEAGESRPLEDLKISDGSVERFAEAASLSVEGANFLGLPLNLGLSFAGGGFILAGLAFWMLGPLSALGKASNVCDSSWVMVAPKRSWEGRWQHTEWVITGASLVFATSPLVVAATQAGGWLHHGHPNGWIMLGSVAGCLLAFVVFCKASRIMWRLRRAEPPPAKASAALQQHQA